MNTSLEWLNSYLDEPCPGVNDCEQVLTSVGFPVDGWSEVSLTGGGRDFMLDVEVTSNRSDCLNHIGLAREYAAASGRRLVLPDIRTPAKGKVNINELTSVVNEAPDWCPVYTARVIRDVKIGTSPAWLVRRLEAVGLRSVNNVVDITNFVLLEMGQPLHAFDMSKLRGCRIVVRPAHEGEQFTAIDGSRHDLTGRMLVIADAEQPVAIAGVMGGLYSEVDEQTRDILLESAVFEPLSVRATSRRLKLSSDSSFRFERGVDPLGVEAASRRAAEMILDLAGGEMADGVIRVGEDEPQPQSIGMRVDRCRSLLGLNLSAEEQAGYLKRLGLQPEAGNGVIKCTIPTYRLDLVREVDLIEEVARSYGLNEIGLQDKIHIVTRPPQHDIIAGQVASDVLVSHGYHEIITFSFVRPAFGEPFLPQGMQAVMIEDERRKAEPMLRPSLIPSLLTCRKSNQDFGNTDVSLFETASTWYKCDGTIRESRLLAILHDVSDVETAIRSVRGTIEELVQRMGGEPARNGLAVVPAESTIYKVGAELVLNDQKLGHFGLLSPALCDRFDLQMAVVVAEMELKPLLALYPSQRQTRHLARFPGIARDLSIVVGETVSWQAIAWQIHDLRPGMLESLEFLGTYRGRQIPKGNKSVSFRMLFRDPDRTLRHEEVDPQVEAVTRRLQEAAGAELRV